jgi:hypothetical protein
MLSLHSETKKMNHKYIINTSIGYLVEVTNKLKGTIPTLLITRLYNIMVTGQLALLTIIMTWTAQKTPFPFVV